MAIDRSTVRNIATLARLAVKDEALDAIAGELSNIFKFIEQLAEVNTEGVAPMASVAAMELPRRADEVTDGDKRDAILANAPEKHDGFFLVPKVVE
jgi:aspartyl-tRNA(Asn)/glutamyl-tRNA(Gln) amidotransferase subunit C